MTKNKTYRDFEKLCYENGLEYDFNMNNKLELYSDWRTQQAFALYGLAIEKGRGK